MGQCHEKETEGWFDTYHLGERLRGNRNRGNRGKSASERVSEREGFRGFQSFSEVFRGQERFPEVFRGLQRFLEVFRGFSQTLSEFHFPLRVAGRVAPNRVTP